MGAILAYSLRVPYAAGRPARVGPAAVGTLPGMPRHIAARTLHDTGLAVWFGGALMGAVGLNGAAATLRDPSERASSATAGWNRWAPVSAVAIGAHLAGAVQLLRTEQNRVRHQDGVALSSAVKTAVTAGALGATAWSGLLNRKMHAAGAVPVEGATEPGPDTPADVARTQRQLKVVQWLIPAFTGALVGVTAWQSEQMRPSQVLRGVLPGGSLSAPALVGGGLTAAALLGVITSSRSGGKAADPGSDLAVAPLAPPTNTVTATPAAPGAGASTAPGDDLLPPVVDLTDGVATTSPRR